MIIATVAALVATATPVAATQPAHVRATVPSKAIPDLAAMVELFDKLFPPQPDPDPARLALARITVRQGLLPSGSFGTAVGTMMGSMVERVLAMKETDLDEMLPAAPRKTSAKPASTKTLHQTLIDSDPFFDERLRLTRAAIEAELIKLSAIVEPRFQEGLARAVARRFDPRQLNDINAFFATDSGRALGSQYMTLWFDPDLSRSMMAALPDMIALAPGAMQRIEAATAGLPKPKGKADPPIKPAKP